ncbi:MAG: hypothetical protein ACRC6V_05425 [Bacteroidales bacterium]
MRTMPLNHTHRDLMNRVIRQDDYVVWTNKKYGTGMIVGQVRSSTEEKIRIQRSDNNRFTNVYPANVVVITTQVERNIAGNIGANLDLEATR